MFVQMLAWIMKEIRFLTALALPPSLMCLSKGIQLKQSNVFIGRVTGENVSSALSALFSGQVIIICTANSISDGLACVLAFSVLRLMVISSTS